MRFRLNWTPAKQRIKDAHEQKDKALPPELCPPELRPGLELYLVAWERLRTQRLFEGGPIPWLAMRRYISGEAITDSEYFETMLGHMEAAYSEWLDSKRKAASGNTAPVRGANAGARRAR